MIGNDRKIALDTETTGLDPKTGDRVVEIGAVELINDVPSGRKLHLYINPERDVPREAVKVHGLTNSFLDDKPVFAHVADEFLSFVGDAQLVIHNAKFDIGFLDAELERAGKPRARDETGLGHDGHLTASLSGIAAHARCAMPPFRCAAGRA